MTKEVERRLRIHFKNVEELKYLHKREKILIDRVEKYNKDLKSCNVDLTDTLKAIDYTQEYIQNNDTTSSIERMLIKETEKIIKDIQKTLRDKYVCKALIRDIEKQVIDFETVIKKTDIDNNDIKLLELAYGKWKWTDEMLADRLSYYISRPTMYRKRIDLLNKIKEVI